MSVLVEGISVIIKNSSIEERLEGRWDGFKELIPNQTFCKDEHLSRVGFLGPQEVGEFIEELTTRGLTFLRDGEPIDIVVVDQQFGPTTTCDWVEFGKARWGKNGSGRVARCWYYDGPRLGFGTHYRADPKTGKLREDLHTPPGWSFEGSLSDQFDFKPNLTVVRGQKPEESG